MTGSEKKDWLKKFHDGDVLIFFALQDEHFSALLEFALRMLENRQDAENAIKDVFIKLYSSRRLIRSRQHARDFLYRVARNQAIDMLQVRSKERNEAARLTFESQFSDN